jgi:hypothetical protein
VLPTVAILLGPAAFDPRNKASTLGVLRHELEHAAHNRLALAWLKRWRDDTSAAKKSFSGWLEKQSMAAADRALVRERIDGGRANTEALGKLEGFIAGFPLEAPDVSEGAHPAYDELEGRGRPLAQLRPRGPAGVRRALRALQARLKGERRTAFGAALRRLKGRDKRFAALADPLLAAQGPRLPALTGRTHVNAARRARASGRAAFTAPSAVNAARRAGERGRATPK